MRGNRVAMIAGMIFCGIWGGAMAEVRSKPPNIVLIAVDTVRPDHLSCYGYERPTSPNIDRFAEGGVLFEQAYSPGSWTVPAFASLFTGYLAGVHGVTQHDRAIPSSMPTITERMQDKGYYTAAIVSNPFLNAKYGYGRGFNQYDDYSIFFEAELASLAAEPGEGALDHEEAQVREMTLVSELVTSQAVTERANDLLEAAEASGKPFFLLAHYFDPHDSYLPPPPFDARFTDPQYDGPMDGRGIIEMRLDPPEGDDLQHLIDRYDGEIAYTDLWVGKLMQSVYEVSDPEDTITIIISDHGEAFAEHGMLQHHNAPYREEVHVPMIWHWPGVFDSGRRVERPVSMMDIAATLRDILGLENMDGMQAQSLQSLLTGGDEYDGPVVSERGVGPAPPHIAITEGESRLHARYTKSIEDEDVVFEAYHLHADRWEQRDVYDPESFEFAEIRRLMSEIWSESRDLRERFRTAQESQDPVRLSDDERRRIEDLGYTDSD